MSIESHLQAIAKKRTALKQQIAEEMCHPLPNFNKITELKKENMRLKEEIMQINIERKQAQTS